MSKTITIIFLISAASIATLHYLLLELHLYWRYEWIDIPMHLLGGAVIVLGVFALGEWRKRFYRYRRILLLLVLVLCGAFTWELFQYSIGWSVFKENFIIDTVTDIMFGLVGALLGLYVANNLEKLK